jgi:1-aminocyclopropane-1-carboxylate deaminase/D-cysteine desulfhydrase-like pyridoxal-dependent ACC family enzyme
MMAQTEAIFLDPVYTGKAISGLVGLINIGHFTKKDSVLFIHTGGVAADFAYSAELSQ